MSEPAFTITFLDGTTIGIFAEGRVSGLLGATFTINNRIPALLAAAHQAGWEEGRKLAISQACDQASIATDSRD